MKKNILIMVLVFVVIIAFAFGLLYIDANFRFGSAAYSISNS